jgi:hypothetical protein
MQDVLVVFGVLFAAIIVKIIENKTRDVFDQISETLEVVDNLEG